MPIHNRHLRSATAVLVLAALAFGAPPAARAHGGGAAKGYTATITAVTPSVPGLELRILDGEDRIELINDTGGEIVVFGYEGEPYLRFTDRGVEVNLGSPAHYLNDDRYGDVELPTGADPTAAPRWQQLTGKNRWEWHDHRIHWMSEQPPPIVRAEPDVVHRIFEWTIIATFAGQPFEIAGTLDYSPPPGGNAPSAVYLAVPLALVALAALGLAWRRTRRERPAAARGEQGSRT